MIQDRKETPALPRVRRETEEGVPVGLEELIEQRLGAQVLRRGLLRGRVPEEEIVLREPGLDGVLGEVLADVGEGAAAVAGVDVDTLTQQFLDFRDERELGGEIEAVERVLCGLQTARQGAGVVALRGLDILRLDQFLPEPVDVQSLLDADVRQMCISPGHGIIAVQLGVVAL